MNTYAIEAIHSDQGSIVVFEGWRVPSGQDDPLFPAFDALDQDTTAYLIAVDHRMAQAIIDDLDGGEPVIVEAEGWQIVGTVR